MMSKRAMILNTLLILAVGLCQLRCAQDAEPIGTESTADAPILLEVTTLRVEPAEWLITVPISGNLHSLSIVEIKSEVGGRLIAAYFEEGERVAKNQVLAVIDPTNYQLAREQASAALLVAEAGLDRAKVMLDHSVREKKRADNLLRSGGITEKDHQAAVTNVKDAESQARVAEAQCNQARSAISIAEKSLQDCRIVALADGRVQKKSFDVGSLLVPGSPVYTLIDNTRLELECDLPSYQLADIRIGQKAVFTTPTWGEQTFEGAVAAISPMVESDNRTIKIKLKISNPGEKLRSGMFANGVIEIGREKEALVIPRSALVGEESSSRSGSVYVVENGRAHLRDVRVGGVRRDLLWITQGLNPLDYVITEVGPTLRDGSAVRISTKQNVSER
jgi:RND family efflux transporter MFP subunit